MMKRNSLKETQSTSSTSYSIKDIFHKAENIKNTIIKCGQHIIHIVELKDIYGDLKAKLYNNLSNI